MAIRFDAQIQGVNTLAKALPKIRAAIVDAGYFATINAAEGAQADVRLAMQSKLDRPTPFIVRSLRITSGSGGRVGRAATDRNVELGFKDTFATLRHDPVTDTLEPQVEGGRRRAKPVELRLRDAGILDSDEYLAASSTAKRNRYGNISPGEFVKMLSDLRTFTEAGFDAQSKYRYKRGSGNYFVLQGGGFKGIFRAASSKRAGAYGAKQVQNASLVWLIVKGAPTYSKRLPFYKIAQEGFARRFPKEFSKVLDRQLAKVA